METNNQNDDNKQIIEIEQIEQINKTITPPKKKVSRGVHVFSVVMHMLRRRRRRKTFNTGFWRHIVDSVRKARSEITIMPSSNFENTNALPPPPPLADTEAEAVQEDGNGGCEDNDVSGTGSPDVFKEASSSTHTGIAGYGSAMCLRDLGYQDNDEDIEDDDDDECFSDIEEGDDMIDEKAEDFIERFYAQMKMQNQVYTQRFNKAKGITSDDE